MAGVGTVYDFGSSLVAGNLAAASITHSSAATADTVVTCTTDHTIIWVTNSLDQPVWLTYDGVKAFWLPAGIPFSGDLNQGRRALRATKIIGVYHDGVQPTTGKIAVTLT
jgi:hypothetical protein